MPLKDIVDLVLQVNVGHYSVEQANPRHEHEWTVWQSVQLPPGKKLIPGVISHATNIVEHPELVAQRLVRLAKIVGRENVLAGTEWLRAKSLCQACAREHHVGEVALACRRGAARHDRVVGQAFGGHKSCKVTLYTLSRNSPKFAN